MGEWERMCEVAVMMGSSVHVTKRGCKAQGTGCGVVWGVEGPGGASWRERVGGGGKGHVARM